MNLFFVLIFSFIACINIVSIIIICRMESKVCFTSENTYSFEMKNVKRKRIRETVPSACQPCRLKHVKCNGQHPCERFFFY